MRRSFPWRSIGSLLSTVLFFGAFLHPVFAARTVGGPTGFGGGVSGYAVSGISWRLDDSRIDRLAGVSFRLDRTARTVEVSVGETSARCDVAGTTARCSFADEPRVASVSSLRVTAVS